MNKSPASTTSAEDEANLGEKVKTEALSPSPSPSPSFMDEMVRHEEEMEQEFEVKKEEMDEDDEDEDEDEVKVKVKKEEPENENAMQPPTMLQIQSVVGLKPERAAAEVPGIAMLKMLKMVWQENIALREEKEKEQRHNKAVKKKLIKRIEDDEKDLEEMRVTLRAGPPDEVRMADRSLLRDVVPMKSDDVIEMVLEDAEMRQALKRLINVSCKDASWTLKPAKLASCLWSRGYLAKHRLPSTRYMFPQKGANFFLSFIDNHIFMFQRLQRGERRPRVVGKMAYQRHHGRRQIS
jgi:hypothetical protein